MRIAATFQLKHYKVSVQHILKMSMLRITQTINIYNLLQLLPSRVVPNSYYSKMTNWDLKMYHMHLDRNLVLLLTKIKQIKFIWILNRFINSQRLNRIFHWIVNFIDPRLILVLPDTITKVLIRCFIKLMNQKECNPKWREDTKAMKR